MFHVGAVPCCHPSAGTVGASTPPGVLEQLVWEDGGQDSQDSPLSLLLHPGNNITSHNAHVTSFSTVKLTPDLFQQQEQL